MLSTYECVQSTEKSNQASYNQEEKDKEKEGTTASRKKGLQVPCLKIEELSS